jgi:hypothetical protein
MMAANPGDDKQAAALAGATAAKPADVQTASVRYLDRPECTEAFADSINQLYFDGQSLRIEFGVTRLDDVKPNAPITGRRYPTQRMVLTPTAAVELINRMQQVGAALAQAGVLKATPKPGTQN